jgi:hypothetical protein
LNLDALYSWGDFYTGTNQELSFDATWRFGGHLILGADLTRDAVRLPEGDFNAIQTGGRAQYAFNPRTDLLLFVQHNNEDQRIDFQLRFHWIPTIGDDFYVVWTSGYTTDPAAEHQFPDGQALRDRSADHSPSRRFTAWSFNHAFSSMVSRRPGPLPARDECLAGSNPGFSSVGDSRRRPRRQAGRSARSAPVQFSSQRSDRQDGRGHDRTGSGPDIMGGIYR